MRRHSFKNCKYGPHERNVFDFYSAQSDEPTPAAVFIHGGGFRNGSKDGINNKTLKALLDAGISVAAFNYRYVQQLLCLLRTTIAAERFSFCVPKPPNGISIKIGSVHLADRLGHKFACILLFTKTWPVQTAVIQSNANLPDFRPWPHLAVRPRWTLPGGRRIFLGTTNPIEIFIRHWAQRPRKNSNA